MNNKKRKLERQVGTDGRLSRELVLVANLNVQEKASGDRVGNIEGGRMQKLKAHAPELLPRVHPGSTT